MEHEEKVVSVELSLDDTIELMQSDDYRDRFKAEYLQAELRYTRLKKFNTKIEAARITEHTTKEVDMPKHDCPDYLLKDQERAMCEYLRILEVRAVIEGIDLTEI
jgi:hypothetical protein